MEIYYDGVPLKCYTFKMVVKSGINSAAAAIS